tara:strand:- start:111 stop:1001 length:891 start_codon:yes stop_codon:yes gene_type:complete
MKMKGEIDNLTGAANNVSNALSFLQVQDGILDSAAQIVSRMSELKGLSQDVLKSTSDIGTYNSEFKDLQNQLHDLSLTKFNGVDLFSDVATTDGTAATTIANGGFETDPGGGAAFVVNKPVATNVTVAGGTSIAISKSLMRHALTFQYDTAGAVGAETLVAGSLASDTNYTDTKNNGLSGNGIPAAAVDRVLTLSVISTDEELELGDVLSEIFTKALENVATLRATNGGEANRLQFEQENIATQAANMEAALGRILDVDIAAETTNLAKQQILVQASASMVAQANSANQVALMLLQ